MQMSYTKRTDIPNKDEYFILYETTGWNQNGQLNAEVLYNAIKNSWFIVTLYDENRLVASGRLVSDGFMQCFICDMIVLPEYQNKGLGKIIMDELLQYCIKRNIYWVQLACAKGKKPFYEKFGFEERALDAPGMHLFIEI